jgi:hypothetical protein
MIDLRYDVFRELRSSRSHQLGTGGPIVLTHGHVGPEVAELLSAWERFDLCLRLHEGLKPNTGDSLGFRVGSAR